MIIKLYSTNSRKNAVNKTLTEKAELPGKLRDETDIIHPVIQLESPITAIAECNYVKIPAFGNRYYFLDDIRSITSNITEITLTVDVLMSHPNLKNCKGIVGRCTTNRSGYLDDDKMITNISSGITTQLFENSMSGENYVLIIAGFKNTVNP